MSNLYGENIKLTIFGQSHSKAIGMTLDGLPAGKVLDIDKINDFLKRRAPGKDEFSTARKEADVPEFISGLKGDVTCGTPVTALIFNSDTRSKDYDKIKNIPRPGHADYPAYVKFDGENDYAGGGHFSGRLTAPLCIAGAICMQLLADKGINVISRIASIGNIMDESPLEEDISEKEFPVVNDAAAEAMKELIREKKAEGDSVGGVIECKVLGLPAGVGDHIFGGLENRISSIIFGIPAVKGIEFGAGFEASKMTGSENNDEFYIEDEKVMTRTNNCGGILGGMSTGMPVTFKVAFKPTPSIYKTQKSVDLKKMEEVELQIEGRHDPCIVKRAVPCVEAACAIAIYDALLNHQKMNL